LTRLLVLIAALLFLAGFAFLTISVTATEGFTLESAISIFVIVLMGVGIIGALRNPPRR
jgi:hypothetical protein